MLPGSTSSETVVTAYTESCLFVNLGWLSSGLGEPCWSTALNADFGHLRQRLSKVCVYIYIYIYYSGCLSRIE